MEFPADTRGTDGYQSLASNHSFTVTSARFSSPLVTLQQGDPVRGTGNQGGCKGLWRGVGCSHPYSLTIPKTVMPLPTREPFDHRCRKR